MVVVGVYKVHKGQAKGPWGPSSVPPLLGQFSHREGIPGQLEEWEPQRQVSLPAPQPSAEPPGGPSVQRKVTGTQVRRGAHSHVGRLREPSQASRPGLMGPTDGSCSKDAGTHTWSTMGETSP